MKVGVALVDVLAGTHAAVGILAALVARAETGKGDRLEVPLLDAALASLVNVASNALVTRTEPARYGNAHASIVPYQTFATRDGWIAIAAANDRLFARLCAVLGRTELAEDDRFATNPARVANREALLRALEPEFRRRGADEWLAALERAGVPAGKVRGVLDAIRHPAERGRTATVTVVHPTAGEIDLVGSPIRFASGIRQTEPPPLLGEHTAVVLSEVGYTAEEIGELERRGVVTVSRKSNG
jgi:crotonobetainyl-CoA:carnitine CoA-transferase CaiB-like acyl-CoA transferase